MSAKAFARAAAEEISTLVGVLNESELNQIAQVIIDAPRLFFTGIGRSGLSARAIAMRLMHIGKVTYVVGEVSTPAIATDDVLVAFTSSGRGSVLEQANAARAHGARIIAFTTGPNSITEMSDAHLTIPARTVVSTAQHAGSLFEQVSLVAGDAICREVQTTLAVPSSELDSRHANIL